MTDLPKGVAEQVAALEREIAALEREAREEIPREMRSAQAVGPVRENADLYLVAGRAHYVQGRLLALRQRLRALRSMDASAVPRDRAGYGSLLTLRDLDSNESREVRLVSPEEGAGVPGACSLLSPMGKALAGRREGDEVEVAAPAGLRFFRIERLVTLHGQEEGAGASPAGEDPGGS